MMHAKGTFDVKVVPQGTEDKADGSTLGRMSLDKAFHGDLAGTLTITIVDGKHFYDLEYTLAAS